MKKKMFYEIEYNETAREYTKIKFRYIMEFFPQVDFELFSFTIADEIAYLQFLKTLPVKNLPAYPLFGLISVLGICSVYILVKIKSRNHL